MYKLFFMTSPIYCLIHSHRLETGQTFDLLLTRLSTSKQLSWMCLILTPGKTAMLITLLEMKELRHFLILSGASVFVYFWDLKESLAPEMALTSNLTSRYRGAID